MVHAGHGEQIRHHARRDGPAVALDLALLGVGEVGKDGGDLGRAAALAGAGQDEQLDEAVVDAAVDALDDEDVHVAHAAANLDARLAVAELGQLARRQLRPKPVGDAAGQLAAGAPGKQARVSHLRSTAHSSVAVVVVVVTDGMFHAMAAATKGLVQLQAGDVAKGVQLLVDIDETAIRVDPGDGVAVLGLRDRKTVCALLDCLVVHGIYARLSPGMGIALQKRMKEGSLAAGMGMAKDDDGLALAVASLLQILARQGEVAHIIVTRNLSDVVAGCGELAFRPGSPQATWRDSFEELMHAIPLHRKLPLFTSLLHRTCPAWFRAEMAPRLAGIPMADGGVRAVLGFMLGTQPEHALEHLDRAARLLCLPPKGVDMETYLARICPQLLHLLQQPAATSLPRAAAFVLSALFSRYPALSVPYIVRPLHEDLLPSDHVRSIHNGLLQLSTLLAHPDPAMTAAVVGPILIPLWELYCYASKTNRIVEADLSKGICLVYIKTVGGAVALEHIAGVLGSPQHAYTSGSDGGIATSKQTASSGLDALDSRTRLFCTLLGTFDDAVVGELFIRITRSWLALRNHDQLDDPFATFAKLKVVQDIMEQHKDKLGQNLEETIELVIGVVEDYLSQLDVQAGLGRATLIVKSGDSDDEDEIDSDTVQIALRLLSALLSEAKQVKQSTRALLSSCQSVLKEMQKKSPTPALRVSAANLVLAMQSIQSESSASTDTSVRYTQALSLLQDDLIPVRAQGMHVLRDLVLAGHVDDVDSVLEMFMGLVGDEDSFIYLNAIKCLAAMTDKFGLQVTHKLFVKYGDTRVEVDERLRYGEVLLRTVQRLGEALTAAVADALCPRLLALVNDSEDVRLKCSSCSVLGAACETSPVGMAAWNGWCVDLALGVLNVETGEEMAVLRRAAIVLLASLLKGISHLLHFPQQHLRDLYRAMKRVRESDSDGLARAQAGSVLLLLQDFQM